MNWIRQTSRRFVSGLTVCLLIPLQASPALAADFRWNTGYGGEFGDILNWDDGETGVPGESDTAIFDVAGIFDVGMYPYYYYDESITDRLLLHRGVVRFCVSEDIWRHHLYNENPDTPGLVIGENDGDIAELVLVDGEMRCYGAADIGRAAGAMGTLTIEAPYADFGGYVYHGALRVGAAGVGILDVIKVNSGSHMVKIGGFAGIDIGSEAGSYGRVRVTGPELPCWLWPKHTGNVNIGADGVGDVWVESGATLDCLTNSGRKTVVALELGSFGSVTVEGADSHWSCRDLDVGRMGIGAVAIRDGATAESEITTIGTYQRHPPSWIYGEGGVGTVTVAGPDSVWATLDLFIGYEGVGRLTLSDGGTVAVSGDVVLANSASEQTYDSVGVLTCSRSGSITVDGDLVRGNGEALIEIELGGSDDYLAPAINATGTVDAFDVEVALVDGFEPLLGDTFEIAHADGGIEPFNLDLPALTDPLAWDVVQDGYNVTLHVVEGDGLDSDKDVPQDHEWGMQNEGSAAAGFGGSAGEYHWNNALDRGVFGDMSFWDNGSGGVPGFEDTAVFDASGVFDVDILESHTNDRLVVRSGLVTFNLDAETDYSLLNHSANTPGITVGHGDGDMAGMALSGGVLHGVFTAIGYENDAYGRMSIEGSAAALESEQSLNVGWGGVGFLNATAGATISSAIGEIGSAAGSFGNTTIEDSGTQWTCDGPLTVGKSGGGELAIRDGAVLSCRDAVIGQYLNSRGDVLVSGAGSDWIIDGTLDVGMTGFGTMIVEDGATVSNHTFAIIATYPGGHPWEIEGEGGYGDVTVRDPGSLWSVDGDLYIGFATEGKGTLTLSQGGSVSATGWVGVFDITYPYQYYPLTIELGDSEDYPAAALQAGNGVTIDDIEVLLVNEFAPQTGDVFWLIHSDGGVHNPTLSLPELTPPLTWEVFWDGSDLKLEVVCPPDVTGDGAVDTDDLLAVMAAWGRCVGCPEDLTGNGYTDMDDLFEVLVNWGFVTE